MKESKVLFKVAGYADAAQQQADVGCVQRHSTPAAAGQSGECCIAAVSDLLVGVSGQHHRMCLTLGTEPPITTPDGESFPALVTCFGPSLWLCVHNAC